MIAQRSSVTICLSVLMVGACLSACKKGRELGTERNALFNAAIIDGLHRSSVENAIIRQQMLYPYHFVIEAPELNDLGLRDALVLASHYRDHPGELSIATGDAGAELHESRVAFVRDLLEREGVDGERLRISSDGLPGGPGVSSTHLLEILEEDVDAAPIALPEMSSSTNR